MPSELSIRSLLRELFGPRVEPPSLSVEGEDAALAAWEARYGSAASGSSRSERGADLAGPLGLLAPRRLIVAMGLASMAVVGACVLPTSYEVPVGLSVEIRASEGERLPTVEIAQYVRERSDATEIEVMMTEEIDDRGDVETTMVIRLWDQNLALGEIEPELREVFAGLDEVEIIETALEGEFETTWGRRLAHHAFELSLREAEFEEVREQVLLDLHAHGVTDEAVFVIIHERDDRREVRVEQHQVISLDQDELPPELEWVADPDAFRELELPTGEGVFEDEDREVRIEIKRLQR